MPLRRHLGIILQTLIIVEYQLPPQLEGISGTCLPQERRKVVIEWPFPSALEIDEERIPLLVQHDIACLKVTIEEGIHLLRGQVFGKHSEIRFELQLVEIQLRCFQEAVLEIVQVEEHALLIKLRLRIAVAEVKSAGTSQLYVRQLPDCTAKQFLLCKIIPSAGFTSTPDSLEERGVAKIGLQITYLIFRYSQHVRYRKPPFFEVSGKIDKGMVLVAARPDDTDNGIAFPIRQPVICAVAAGSFQFLCTDRLAAFPVFI